MTIRNSPSVQAWYQEAIKNQGSYGAPGWRSRLSVRLQPGHDLAVREFEVREFEPHVGLWAHGALG